MRGLVLLHIFLLSTIYCLSNMATLASVSDFMVKQGLYDNNVLARFLPLKWEVEFYDQLSLTTMTLHHSFELNHGFKFYVFLVTITFGRTLFRCENILKFILRV